MKRCSLYAALCVLIASALGCTRTNVTPTPTKKSGNVIISTFTPAPTDVPTASPVPTTDTKRKGVLPGLAPANVTVSLEGQKFTCTNVKKGVVYYERTCTRGVPSVEVFQVVISGTEPFTVDLIQASIRQYDNPDIEVAASILGLVASMAYDGSTPEEARAWVESTIPALSGDTGGTQEMTFGGVKYVLHGSPTALTLEMGELP
jgi:hypothetical protein